MIRIACNRPGEVLKSCMRMLLVWQIVVMPMALDDTLFRYRS